MIMITERTLIIIKPDGVQRNLIGNIISRFEATGLKIVGLQFRVPKESEVREHYTLDPSWVGLVGKKLIESKVKNGEDEWGSRDPLEIGGDILERLVKYMIAGPVAMIVVEGVHATEVVRKLVGGTEPRSSDVGTIRGDYVIDSYALAERDRRAVRNLVHASGSAEEAEKEIALWFSDEQLIEYVHVQEKILYGDL